MKNWLHRHNINRPGHKLTNKKCLGMMILTRNKQHVSSIWKHPFRGALRKNCSANMQQIYRRTVMLCNFIEITLRHGYFPFPHIFRTSFPKNTSGRLLLTIKVRFMKKLRNTEAEFKKALFNKEKASSYRKCLYDTRNEISFCHEKKFVYISLNNSPNAFHFRLFYVVRDWLDTELKIFHFAWDEILCKHPLRATMNNWGTL